MIPLSSVPSQSCLTLSEKRFTVHRQSLFKDGLRAKLRRDRSLQGHLKARIAFQINLA